MSNEWIERFSLRTKGPCKVVPLRDAIRDSVRPGMALHFAFTHNRPMAAIAELLKQFRGTRPRFGMQHLFTTGPSVALMTEGLVEHLVTALLVDPYPAPGPSLPARRALEKKLATVEHWSVLTYTTRLEAAARGLPWLPTKSLIGSSILEENAAHAERDGEVVRLKPLVPDLSFVHAPAADEEGNLLFAPPYAESVWGGLAAKEGVVATVERIVSREVLSRNAHLVAIPASHVRSVSVVPFGAHPAGLSTAGIAGVEPYGDDIHFYRDSRAAGATEEGWRKWVDEWLIEPADHDAYLAKVGAERLLWLGGKAHPDSWRAELVSALSRIDVDRDATRLETMMIAAARTIASKVECEDHASILSGLGAGNLAAWLAHAMLKERGRDVALIAELGMYGYSPRPCDPFLFNFRNLATCTLASDSSMVLGVLLGGKNGRCLGSLGAAQIDAHGNFNSTRLADGTHLAGSGGANDVAAGSREVVITIQAGKSRLVERLPYVTGAGERVTTVVTELGIFEKELGARPLRLTRLVGPLVGGSMDAHVDALRGRCGFAFEIASELAVAPVPDVNEIGRLRLLDPERLFLGTLEN